MQPDSDRPMGASRDLVLEWNEDALEPRYGVVREAENGWIRVEGCEPRAGDSICIVGHEEPKS